MTRFVLCVVMCKTISTTHNSQTHRVTEKQMETRSGQDSQDSKTVGQWIVAADTSLRTIQNVSSVHQASTVGLDKNTVGLDCFNLSSYVILKQNFNGSLIFHNNSYQEEPRPKWYIKQPIHIADRGGNGDDTCLQLCFYFRAWIYFRFETPVFLLPFCVQLFSYSWRQTYNVNGFSPGSGLWVGRRRETGISSYFWSKYWPSVNTSFLEIHPFV